MLNNLAKKILIVDDEVKITEVIRSYLENNGYEVYAAFDGKHALALYEQVHYGHVQYHRDR